MLLQLKNIGKIYNSNDIITIGVRGINLDFDYNEFVTIEGESGSGKSTLLNVIGANDTYEEGELYFNGSQTSHYSESDWEKYREENIATIFQDFNIIENLTVLENVELALLRLDDLKERKKIAVELIRRVGLTKQINQKGSKLSGGEKQRTVIARALAKDSPIILADEPTGNLDVKSSREVAKLLKEVSKDKLVIVVTHNPEFFKEYATRRVRVYDGGISEDEMITPPTPVTAVPQKTVIQNPRMHNFKNVIRLGILNYKSRPKFTMMMSLALLVCALTLFIVISIFGSTMVRPIVDNLDGVGIDGKVVISSETQTVTEQDLDRLAHSTNAGFFFLDKNYSEFSVDIPKSIHTLKNYSVNCLYAPYEHCLARGEGVLVLPKSAGTDADYIRKIFTDAGVGITDISVDVRLNAEDIRLYLSYDMLKEHGRQIKAINSVVKLGDDKNLVYRFEIGEGINHGEVKLVNSNYWNVINKTVVFEANSERSYMIVDDTEKNENISGLIVRMNAEDYNDMFRTETYSKQSCLYFSDNKTASAALEKMDKGFMGLLSTREIYLQNAGDAFADNILWYTAMIAVSVLFGALISIIFMRSVKIFQTDFAVYRTLGIANKIALRSLYVQMALVFLPTLILLPLISLIVAILPGSTLPFISLGNFFFIEIMLLLIVELVAFGFNKSLNGQSIRQSLRRGSK